MSDHKDHHILVVDDFEQNYTIINFMLGQEYDISWVDDGVKALEKLETGFRPDLILMDVMMPRMDGFEACKKIKENYLTRDIPVIFTTALGEVKDEQKGFDVGAVDYIVRPINPAIIRARVKTHLALADQNKELQRLVDERTREIRETQVAIIERLGRAAEYKDNETGLHVIRMSWYSYILARALGMNQQDAEALRLAAPMHDIGKIKIPDIILQRKGKLSDGDMDLMRQHARFGAEIIGEHHSELLKMARDVALAHHEKWDGSGYPEGLKEGQIPLTARIVSVADVFDALTTRRPYKPAWSIQDTVEYIESKSGSHFDPRVVNVMKEYLPQFVEIHDKYKEDLSNEDRNDLEDPVVDENIFSVRR